MRRQSWGAATAFAGDRDFWMASRILRCTMGNEIFQCTRKKRARSTRAGGAGVGRREKRAKQRKPHTSFPFCVGVQFSREFISAFNHQIELQEQIQGREQPKLNLVE